MSAGLQHEKLDQPTTPPDTAPPTETDTGTDTGTAAPERPVVELNRSQKALIAVVLTGAVAIAALGFVGSYASVADLARDKGFGDFSSWYPLGPDVGIVVCLALDLLLTWLRIPFPLLRQTAWLLTAATIAFNGAAAWGDPIGVAMHATIPILFVITVEAGRHSIARLTAIAAGRDVTYPPLRLWLVAPVMTARVWRTQARLGLPDYHEVLNRRRDIRVYRARMRQEHGLLWWTDAERALPLRLARYGLDLQTARRLPQVERTAAAEAEHEESLATKRREHEEGKEKRRLDRELAAEKQAEEDAQRQREEEQREREEAAERARRQRDEEDDRRRRMAKAEEKTRLEELAAREEAARAEAAAAKALAAERTAAERTRLAAEAEEARRQREEEAARRRRVAEAEEKTRLEELAAREEAARAKATAEAALAQQKVDAEKARLDEEQQTRRREQQRQDELADARRRGISAERAAANQQRTAGAEPGRHRQQPENQPRTHVNHEPVNRSGSAANQGEPRTGVNREPVNSGEPTANREPRTSANHEPRTVNLEPARTTNREPRPDAEPARTTNQRETRRTGPQSVAQVARALLPRIDRDGYRAVTLPIVQRDFPLKKTSAFHALKAARAAWGSTRALALIEEHGDEASPQQLVDLGMKADLAVECFARAREI